MKEKAQEISWKLKKFLLKLFYCPQKFFIIDGEIFYGGKPSATKNNMLAFNKKHVLKVENFKHDKKRNNLEKECRFLKLLTSKKCLSNPKIIKTGTCFYKRPFYIMEKLGKNGMVKPSDIFLSMLEQQKQGISHEDTKSDNIIFDGTIAKLIDYDQAIYSRKLKNLSLKENLLFFINRRADIWFTDYGKSELGKNKKEVVENFNLCFEGERFNFALTSLFEKITENGECYWELDEEEIFAKGKNNIKNISHILETLEFKKDEKILDFGSDIGSLSFYLEGKGQVYFFDPNSLKMQAVQMISNILNKKITPYNLVRTANFDTIFFLNDGIKLSQKFIETFSKKAGRIVAIENEKEKKEFKNFNLIKEFELENGRTLKIFEK